VKHEFIEENGKICKKRLTLNKVGIYKHKM